MRHTISKKFKIAIMSSSSSAAPAAPATSNDNVNAEEENEKDTFYAVGLPVIDMKGEVKCVYALPRRDYKHF